MGYITSASTLTIKAYLTQKGRELYFNGEDSDIIAKYFCMGDSDNNYIISTNNTNILTSGFVPNISGVEEHCINTVSQGVDIKYKLKSTRFKKGDIINQHCQPPFTLVQEISNGDGTSYFQNTENSTTCGFSYKSNVFSKSFIKNSCTGSSVGQSYVVSTTYGQFTGNSQDEADTKALNYVNNSGQTVANMYGACMYSNDLMMKTFTKSDCPNGGNPYVTSALTNTFFSTVSTQDANNKALIYLNSNGQVIANQNGSCKILTGTALVPLYTPVPVTVTKTFQVIQFVFNFNHLSLTQTSGTINGSRPDLYLLQFKLPPDLMNKSFKFTLYGNKPSNDAFVGVNQTNLIGNIIPLTNTTYTNLTGNNYQIDINVTNNLYDNINIDFNVGPTFTINFAYTYKIEVSEIKNIYQ